MTKRYRIPRSGQYRTLTDTLIQSSRRWLIWHRLVIQRLKEPEVNTVCVMVRFMHLTPFLVSAGYSLSLPARSYTLCSSPWKATLPADKITKRSSFLRIVFHPDGVLFSIKVNQAVLLQVYIRFAQTMNKNTT